MLKKLILSVLIINILMKTTSSQYYPNPYYQSMPQQYYQAQQDLDYEADPSEYRRSSSRKEYGSSGGRLPRIEYEYDDESEESKCSCNRCKNPKPHCRDACASCPSAQGGVVFVPYPYPLMLPTLVKNETTTTTAQPTTRSTTVTTTTIMQTGPYDPPYRLKYAQNNGDKKYMLTSFRKTKPTWEPKYGIVPIPDNLAEKLMSQLRNVRELQARRF